MTPTTRSQRTRKIVALSAAGTVLAVGAISTLAAWNDSEWVWGGANSEGDPIGTSTFNVQQNREQAPDNESDWTDHATMDAAGLMVFSPDALALTPGDVAFAPVALRTTAESDAGQVTLQPAVSNAAPVGADDPDELLWGALTYSVRTTAAATSCSADTWDDFGADIVSDQSLGAVIGASAQNLAADAGSIQYYCFRIELPADVASPDELQGRSVAPAWQFQAESQ